MSYAKLCQSVKPGNTILIADGSISIKVNSIVSDTELKGTVLNSKKLGERKNCNLPGVKVDIPVLTEKDINDVQNFCCKNKMDFIAASFVQTGEDVQLIRSILDEAGGQNVQIISKIENEGGVANINDILKYSDGIMVARGDLGMEIPSEKVALCPEDAHHEGERCRAIRHLRDADAGVDVRKPSPHSRGDDGRGERGV